MPSSSVLPPPDAAADDEIQEVDIPSRSKGKGKAKATVADSEAETETDQRPKQTKSRSKPKATSETETDQRPKQTKSRSKSKSKQAVASDSEIEDITPEAFKGATGKRKGSNDGQESELKRKGKRKASSISTVDDGSEGREDNAEPSSAKRRKRNEVAERPKPKPIARPGKAAPAVPRPRADSTASTAVSGSPKPGTTKKRRINIFGTSQSTVDLGAFEFGSQVRFVSFGIHMDYNSAFLGKRNSFNSFTSETTGKGSCTVAELLVVNDQ